MLHSIVVLCENACVMPYYNRLIFPLKLQQVEKTAPVCRPTAWLRLAYAYQCEFLNHD